MAVAAFRQRTVEERYRPSTVNVGQIERWFSMAAGGALVAYALKRRQAQGGAMALAGAYLLFRGATGHCDAYHALGINRARQKGTGVLADIGSDTRYLLGGDRGTHVEESVVINCPAMELYRFWRDFENLPKFMRHLEYVAIRDAGVSHWVATGPGGTRVEWDARVINDIDGRLIAWQTLRGSTVASAGSVHFTEMAGGTEVRVHLQYRPLAGKLGSAVAWMLGEDPGVLIREDLLRFKQLMETTS